ncbi:MAG: hypothetical protein HRT38_05365 [Alteromonadaceae bacterium]|nr:hypothetical protein [Alteromonadaceae bacterium]
MIISRTDVNERLIIAYTQDIDDKFDWEQVKLYSRPDIDTEYIAPQTNIEKRLTQMLQVNVVTEINAIWEIKLS